MVFYFVSPGPSGLTRASERSRWRQLLKPRVERALRGGRALNVGEFPPRHEPAALWNAGTRVTGRRTSGIVECWAPRYWWTYQRRCVNAGPKGSTQERVPPLGNRPENWWAERRSFVR